MSLEYKIKWSELRGYGCRDGQLTYFWRIAGQEQDTRLTRPLATLKGVTRNRAELMIRLNFTAGVSLTILEIDPGAFENHKKNVLSYLYGAQNETRQP